MLCKHSEIHESLQYRSWDKMFYKASVYYTLNFPVQWKLHPYIHTCREPFYKKWKKKNIWCLTWGSIGNSNRKKQWRAVRKYLPRCEIPQARRPSPAHKTKHVGWWLNIVGQLISLASNSTTYWDGNVRTLWIFSKTSTLLWELGPQKGHELLVM